MAGLLIEEQRRRQRRPEARLGVGSALGRDLPRPAGAARRGLGELTIRRMVVGRADVVAGRTLLQRADDKIGEIVHVDGRDVLAPVADEDPFASALRGDAAMAFGRTPRPWPYMEPNISTMPRMPGAPTTIASLPMRQVFVGGGSNG